MKPLWFPYELMVIEAQGRVHEPQKSKTYIRISQKLRRDSAFPFERGEAVWVRIDARHQRLIVEKMKGKR